MFCIFSIIYLSVCFLLFIFDSAQPGGQEVSKERIEKKRLWFDVTQLSEELLNAFDWLPNQPN